MKHFRILVINPGSTSTKVSLHEDETCLFTKDVFHDSTVLVKFPTINDQLDYRMEVIYRFLEEDNIDMTQIDAIAGRGGACYSVESGIYEVNEQMVKDTHDLKGGLYHSSMLGVQMAWELQKKYGCRVFMMDPTVMDELQDVARITGIRGIYRKAYTHALNLKAAAKKYAKDCGRDYKDLRLVVAHIDGGISIAAHRDGRQIDANDAGGGEGPFSPTRMGSMSVTDVLHNLFDKKPEEIRNLCSVSGGLSSHFGTSNSDVIHKMVEEGDVRANRVWDAMIYQTNKYIGAMATVLDGKVDAIVLTGGLLRFDDVVEKVKASCSWIAPIAVYPGEFEHEAMSSGALSVLRGETEPKQYTGKPVFVKFPED